MVTPASYFDTPCTGWSVFFFYLGADYKYGGLPAPLSEAGVYWVDSGCELYGWEVGDGAGIIEEPGGRCHAVLPPAATNTRAPPASRRCQIVAEVAKWSPKGDNELWPVTLVSKVWHSHWNLSLSIGHRMLSKMPLPLQHCSFATLLLHTNPHFTAREYSEGFEGLWHS